MKRIINASALAFAGLSTGGANATDVRIEYAAFSEEDFGHPLNDGWLGMPVETRNGREIGFVIDAPLAPNGDIVEIVIDTSTSGIRGLDPAITVSADQAALFDNHVEIEAAALRVRRL